MKGLIIRVVLLTVVLAQAGHAQYFGRNRVQYEGFNWRVITTEHFNVYYYGTERDAAVDAARMAERGYARLSRVLNHQYRERKPIILYASHSDFEQTTIPFNIGEGLGGVTDFQKSRVILPFTGSYKELDHVLQHELVHQFQYDIFSRGGLTQGLRTLVAVNPPLWFMEGMAEYLSVGPITPLTAMWLRDAALEGTLPTAEELQQNRRFPYRFGHSIWSYIGERWGDETIGDILTSSTAAGIDGAILRVLGLSFADLVDEWREAVQLTFLPQLEDLQRARTIARAGATKKRDGGLYRLGPALSPNGEEVAFFSARDLFMDLYVKNLKTDKIRRIIKSTNSPNFESLRFITSTTSWSPDGQYLALTAKRGEHEDIVLRAMHGGKSKRLKVPVDAVLNPTFSPDGSQIVFTGLMGGWSDLYIVDIETEQMSRLTNDRFADYHPVWSPDGRTIAFATDRGPQTRPETLDYGDLGIALYHLDSGRIEILERMDRGNNINPQWSPDGESIAFVSDRTGVANLFLFELSDRQVYQLTNFYTALSGITDVSPAMSWARDADRLAFLYFEDGDHDIYLLDNPRGLKRAPYEDTGTPINIASLLRSERDRARQAREDRSLAEAQIAAPRESESILRTRRGFRPSDTDPVLADSGVVSDISITALLDSAELALPDTEYFSYEGYRVRFRPDYIVQPQIGFQRNNLNQGFFGGAAIRFSDLLDQHFLTFAGQVNGRLADAQFLGSYTNIKNRINWTVGASVTPTYLLNGAQILARPDLGGNALEQRSAITRFSVRQAFVRLSRPFNQFRRVDLDLRAVNVDEDQLVFSNFFTTTGIFVSQDFATIDQADQNYFQPSLALVHDNALFGYTAPMMGQRARFQVGKAFGTWNFWEFTSDYRRYDRLVGPFTLATRAMYFGRRGGGADRFRIFIGNTRLIRGYTFGSFQRNECRDQSNLTSSTSTGCTSVDRLVGSQIAVVNAELRFPLTRTGGIGILPTWFPPLEAALFYDFGLAWSNGDVIKFNLDDNDTSPQTRGVLRSYGFSVRANVFGFLILRTDYAVPLNRQEFLDPNTGQMKKQGGYVTLSIGPAF